MSVMIDIEKAIQNGNALRAARIKADADKAENDRVEAAAAKHRKDQELQLQAEKKIDEIPDLITKAVARGETRVNLNVDTGLNSGPLDRGSRYSLESTQQVSICTYTFPEPWLRVIEECKKHGIKAQVFHDSYMQADYNDMGGKENEWNVTGILVSISWTTSSNNGTPGVVLV